MKIELKNGEKIDFPNNIEFEHDETFTEITLNILRPELNMQTDSACFEAWSLLLKLKTSCKKVTLSFKKPDFEITEYLRNLNSDEQHYMRFLYRLSKFKQQMKSWFFVSDKSNIELDFFINEFLSREKTNNIPSKKSQYNKEKGDEHVLEKAFMKIPSLRNCSNIQFELFDQLPIGLFSGAVCKENKIFNTGYIDLWGKNQDDNSLNIFELKDQNNRKVGIISELFFYANIAFDLLHQRDNIKLNSDECEYRGYKEFISLRNSNVKAWFLVDKLHPSIEAHPDEILHILNENSPISYGIKRYSIDAESFDDIKVQLDCLQSDFQ